MDKKLLFRAVLLSFAIVVLISIILNMSNNDDNTTRDSSTNNIVDNNDDLHNYDENDSLMISDNNIVKNDNWHIMRFSYRPGSFSKKSIEPRDGYVAFTLSVDQVTGLNSFVFPGHVVDLISTNMSSGSTKAIVQTARVLAVDSLTDTEFDYIRFVIENGSEEEKRVIEDFLEDLEYNHSYSYITIEVLPRDAVVISHFIDMGYPIRFVLRNFDDENKYDEKYNSFKGDD